MVTLLEPGLQFLLGSQEGPVGRDIRRRAEQVATQAGENASVRGTETLGIVTGDLHSGIRYVMEDGPDGPQAVVLTDAQHAGFFYPAYWDRNGKPWLTNALRDRFDA